MHHQMKGLTLKFNIMKKLFSLILLLFFITSLYSQNSTVTAKIDGDCNSQPATISIANGHSASGFTIISLASGNNCNSGAKFTDKGFVIKNSSGNIVYKYNVNAKGIIYIPNGELSKLKLGAGIYYIYVDGGSGASLTLNFRM